MNRHGRRVTSLPNRQESHPMVGYKYVIHSSISNTSEIIHPFHSSHLHSVTTCYQHFCSRELQNRKNKSRQKKREKKGRPSDLQHHIVVQCRDPYLLISCSIIWFEAIAHPSFGEITAMGASLVVHTLKFATKVFHAMVVPFTAPITPDSAWLRISVGTTT